MSALGKATNELGKLFVDIGLGGVGNVLKGLNSISASFLLTKTAAVELTKPFVELGKKSIDNAVKFGQLNATLGISLEKVQQLTTYLEQFKVGEGAIGSLGNIMDMLNRVNMGLEGIDGNFVTAMTRLGLDWKKYRGGTFEDMLNLVSDVQEKVKDMDIGKARVYMQQIGLPTELLYAFKQGGFDLRGAYARTDESIKRAQETNQKWTLFKKNFEARAGAIITDMTTPAINKTLDTANKIVGPDEKAAAEGRAEVFRFLVPKVLDLANPANILMREAPNVLKDLLNDASSGVPNPLSSNASGVSINITNQNEIYGNNADEIADKIAGITKDDILDAENNAFQLSDGTVVI